MKRIAICLAVLALGCGVQESFTPGVALTGVWGGDHLRVDLTPTGGMLEYDCADGEINSALVPDAVGRVAADGIHNPGMGGPIPIGYVPPRKPARYTGIVSANRLTLTVMIVATGETVGTFVLYQGREGRVFKCL
jgi:hypothetical protein